jgi:uncharacterized protein with NAD-binding domain and iron-sulfur cluster
VEKRKIVIIGGGMAALSTAFELTQTEDLRAKHSVSIYQMGWRLGGKCASGRDRQGRIIEHGLHVWFGCYENAFRLLRRSYDEWKLPEGQLIRCWDQALKSQNFTPIGSGDSSDFICLRWPENNELPGEEVISKLSIWGCVTNIIGLAAMMYEAITSRYPNLQKAEPLVHIDPTSLPESILTAMKPDTGYDASPKSWLRFAASRAKLIAEDSRYQKAEEVRGIAYVLRKNAVALRKQVAFTSVPQGEFLAQTIDIGAALIWGIVFDVMLAGIEVVDLDRMEFREWLVRNGASRDSAFQSRAVRALYDTMFQYCEGDLRRPSYAAGTAAQVVLRLYGSYKGSYAWEMQAGMGEVVVAPLYKVLKQRGVKFNFFYKLKRIELTADGRAINSLYFDQQVKLKDGTYDPIIDPTAARPGLVYWPAMPRWEFIENGGDLCKRKVDFESYWCAEQPVDTLKLEQGSHFDDAVLAIPLGAFKQLSGAEGPCDEIIEANDRFRAMTDNLVLVPSISVQAWCTRDLPALGWSHAKPATVSGPQPLDIWAGMTQVLQYETWDASQQKPKSLHYFCNVLASQLYRRPPSESDVPTKATALARDLAIKWFEEKARYIWPATIEAGKFTWDVLFDPEDRPDKDRIEAQILRANVDPSSCCVASTAGSTEWRLNTEESGVRHLFLAGSWVNTGFSTECVEAAVMSGCQASRAICGSPKLVWGEDFMHSGGASGLGSILAFVFLGLRFLMTFLWELSSVRSTRPGGSEMDNSSNSRS